MCHEIGRPHMRGLPDYQVPEIPTAMETILHMAKMVNRDVRFVGVSLNTSNVTPEEAAAFKKKTAEQTGLPVVTPLKDGVAPIVDMRRAGRPDRPGAPQRRRPRGTDTQEAMKAPGAATTRQP